MARRRSGNTDDKLCGKDLGTRMRKLRKAKNVSIQKLADEIGVTRNYISQLEKGEKIPSLDTLVRIANVLKVCADELLCDYLVAEKTIAPAEINAKIAALPKPIQRHIEQLIDIEIDYFKSLNDKRRT